jgi:ABC-type transporter Mla maintaining outer membrane lipid asymmetry permease subunit MlaE
MSTEVDDSSRGGETLNKVVDGTRRLGEQTAFYGNALAATPDAVRRYPAEVLRLIANMGLGTGALAVIGGTVVIIGFLTLSTGALIAVQGYNTLSNVGIEALTGFLGAFLNVRFIAPATAGVALAATIGAGATAQLGAMRINEEIDALEVMGIPAITYLASTRIVAGVVAVIPIYTVAVLMSFLATRFGTTIIYGAEPWRLRPLLLDVPAADGPVVVLRGGAGHGSRRDGGAYLLRVHRDRRSCRCRRGGRPSGAHLDYRRGFHSADHHAVGVRAVRQLPPVGVTA